MRRFPCSSSLYFACERAHLFPAPRPPLPPLLPDPLDPPPLEQGGNSLDTTADVRPLLRARGFRGCRRCRRRYNPFLRRRVGVRGLGRRFRVQGYRGLLLY